MSILKRTRKCAVTLLSGGMDSTTTLALAKGKGFRVYALTVRYGQRHRKEIENAVQRALKEIPMDYRLVVILRDIEGFSYDEIAETLRISLGTVKSRLWRGRLELKKTIHPDLNVT